MIIIKTRIQGNLYIKIGKIIINSETKLIEGGQDIFIQQKKNHQYVKTGLNILILFMIRALRDLNCSYEQFNKKKRPDEQIPCPIIIKKAPIQPIQEKTNILPRTGPIWATDE